MSSDAINYPNTLEAAVEAGRYFGRNLAPKIGFEIEDAEQQASIWALQWWHDHSDAVNIWTFMKRRVADFIRSHPECAWTSSARDTGKSVELTPHIAECVECGSEFSQPRRRGRKHTRCDECRRVPADTDDPDHLVAMDEFCMAWGDCTRSQAWRTIGHYNMDVVSVDGEAFVWSSDVHAAIQHFHDELVAAMDWRNLSPAELAEITMWPESIDDW